MGIKDQHRALVVYTGSGHAWHVYSNSSVWSIVFHFSKLLIASFQCVYRVINVTMNNYMNNRQSEKSHGWEHTSEGREWKHTREGLG